MNVNFEKVKAEMAEHWEMDAATFDAHPVTKIHSHGDWAEIEFGKEDSEPTFYIEVNEKSEVWNYAEI